METPENLNRYFDRELSWIQFNTRVLAEAMDRSNPLLERLKFLGIVSSNFDEFFMVRIPGVNEDDLLMKEIYEKSFELLKNQEKYFLETIAPEMEKAGIRRILPGALTEQQFHYLRTFFKDQLFPLLTPIAVREETPFPNLINLSLYQIVELLNTQSPFTRCFALTEIPRNLPRMVALPAEGQTQFILLEDVVSLFSKELFPGFEIVSQGTLRLTRAAELSVDEEKDEDFAKLMSEMLRQRRRNYVVRLEIQGCPSSLEILKRKIGIEDYQIHNGRAWPDMKTISQFAFQPNYPELKRPVWQPVPVPEFETGEMWKEIKSKDRLVHYPYESFDTVVQFLIRAAEDPDVLAIKQTLYRAGESSSVIAALEKAAERGKQVTVLVELKARFDEQKNIEWAQRLMNAGASVLYGVTGLKTHAKASLVIRREIEGIRRYVYLSTGNFNEKTAQVYSDIGFFSANEDLAGDVSSFFNIITGYSHPVEFNKITLSPFSLRRKVERLILREAMRSRKDSPGLILAKMNSLVDARIIEALYRASQMGVQIKLNVRGICCLKPGVPGLSENIEVVSIVDMFLEHSRIFYFLNGGDEEIYLSSADWMPRNFDRRLEILFPIQEEKNKKELRGFLDDYFKDNVKAWNLSADGSYQKLESPEDKRFRVQESLCRYYSDKNRSSRKVTAEVLKPQRPKSVSGN